MRSGGVREIGLRMDEDRMARVGLCQILDLDFALGRAFGRENDGLITARGKQHAGLVVLKDQDGGKDRRGYGRQVGALNDFRPEVKASRSLAEQERAHAPPVIGKAGLDGFSGFRPAEMPRQENEIFKKRVNGWRGNGKILIFCLYLCHPGPEDSWTPEACPYWPVRHIAP